MSIAVSPEQSFGTPNTWEWATNLAEKVRRSKIAQFAGRLLLANYQPPKKTPSPTRAIDPKLLDFDGIYPGYRNDPFADRYTDQPAPEQLSPQALSVNPQRYLVRNKDGDGYRFETPQEYGQRMDKFHARHPEASPEDRQHFERTGHLPIMVELPHQDPLSGGNPPQATVG